MVSTFISLLDIQSWWEIPCIAHFCSLFSSAFDLPDIDIEDLESALLTDGTEETVGLLPELIVRILRGCDSLKSNRDEITTSNYQMFLRRFLRHQCRENNVKNYFDTDTDFSSLPVRDKLLILYSLCHFRLESADVYYKFNNLEADSLRVEPLGFDSKNSSYWYFFGTRLYREDIKTNSKETIWQVICFTEEDWQNLATKLKACKNKKERALLTILEENFLPKLPQLFLERERIRRRKLLQFRNSARIRSADIKNKEYYEKQELERIEREKYEEHLKLAEATNKKRRRSQSNSNGSGISTYAGSIHPSVNSSDFLCKSEKFCLSPDLIGSSLSPPPASLIHTSFFPPTPSQSPQPEERNSQQNIENLLITDNSENQYRSQTQLLQHQIVDSNQKKNILDNSAKVQPEPNKHNQSIETPSSPDLHLNDQRKLNFTPTESHNSSVNNYGDDIFDNDYYRSRSNSSISYQQQKILSDSNDDNESLITFDEDKENLICYRRSDTSSSESLVSEDSCYSNNKNHCKKNLFCGDFNKFKEKNCDFTIKNNSSIESKNCKKKLLNMAPVTNASTTTTVKLPGRQTNNSLSSISENLFLPTTFEGQSTSGGGKKMVKQSKVAEKKKETKTAKKSEKNEKTDKSGKKMKNSVEPIVIKTPEKPIKRNEKKDVPPDDNSIQKKKKTKTNDSFTETDEVLQIGMHKVLVYVKNHRDAWPFMDPVEEDIAPRYYTIIRRPMDLLKMEDKLDNGEYKKFSEFRNDFKLIVNNCRLYNGQNNEYTEMVNNLQESFDKATKKYFDNLSDEDDDELNYPDSKLNVFREKYFNKSSNETNNDTEKIKSTIKEEIFVEKQIGDAIDVKNEDIDVDKNDIKNKSTKRKRKDKDKKRKKKIKLDNGKKSLINDESDLGTESEEVFDKKQISKRESGDEGGINDEQHLVYGNEDNEFEMKTKTKKSKKIVENEKTKKLKNDNKQKEKYILKPKKDEDDKGKHKLKNKNEKGIINKKHAKKGNKNNKAKEQTENDQSENEEKKCNEDDSGPIDEVGNKEDFEDEEIDDYESNNSSDEDFELKKKSQRTKTDANKLKKKDEKQIKRKKINPKSKAKETKLVKKISLVNESRYKKHKNKSKTVKSKNDPSLQQQSPEQTFSGTEFDEEDVDRNEKLTDKFDATLFSGESSRSPTPNFKIDLHKKYANTLTPSKGVYSSEKHNLSDIEDDTDCFKPKNDKESFKDENESIDEENVESNEKIEYEPSSKKTKANSKISKKTPQMKTNDNNGGKKKNSTAKIDTEELVEENVSNNKKMSGKLNKNPSKVTSGSGLSITKGSKSDVAPVSTKSVKKISKESSQIDDKDDSCIDKKTDSVILNDSENNVILTKSKTKTIKGEQKQKKVNNKNKSNSSKKLKTLAGDSEYNEKDEDNHEDQETSDDKKKKRKTKEIVPETSSDTESEEKNKKQPEKTDLIDPEVLPFLDKYDLIKQRRRLAAVAAVAAQSTSSSNIATKDKNKTTVKKTDKTKNKKASPATKATITNTIKKTDTPPKNKNKKQQTKSITQKPNQSKTEKKKVTKELPVKKDEDNIDVQNEEEKRDINHVSNDDKHSTSSENSTPSLNVVEEKPNKTINDDLEDTVKKGDPKQIVKKTQVDTSTEVKDAKQPKETKLKDVKNKSNKILKKKDSNSTENLDEIIPSLVPSPTHKKKPASKKQQILESLSSNLSSNMNNLMNKKKGKNSSGITPPVAIVAPTQSNATLMKATNMEALELETEQTLKDINRWLEHTPRFSEFSSASNSPSRYNLLDDFDAVAAKLDPADFRRPLEAISANNATANLTSKDTDPKLATNVDSFDDLKKSSSDNKLISDLIPSTSSNKLSLLGIKDNDSQNSSGAGTAAGANSSPSITSNIPSSLLHPPVKKEPSTTQLLPHPPPPPPHIKNQLQKEAKRKSLKEKLASVGRRKDLLRTIDRLQPGKSKGNLLTNVHNTNKPEELIPLGPLANKIKEVKNSLVVETDESAPKLSLGSVLNTSGFGLGQLHNFGDEIASGEFKIKEAITADEDGEKDNKNEIKTIKSSDGRFIDDEKHSTNSECDEKSMDDTLRKEANPFQIKKDETQTKTDSKTEETKTSSSATPNLSAWFKAFGAPKKSKKQEDEEEKKRQESTELSNTQITNSENSRGSSCAIKSPVQTIIENFPLPGPRQRKASTGSTASERSSYSQDPDSPRIGMDDRYGPYPAPYTSPIGTSPIMVSPKPDENIKPSSPYPLNGAIKVGFYQDTTTKSSPEKSCSPREHASPAYPPQFSQHIYSATSPNVNATTEILSPSSTPYGAGTSSQMANPLNQSGSSNINSGNNEQKKTPNSSGYSPRSPAQPPTPTLYEQYKQPRSQESDYNSSMSPSTNPNSPYQQPQSSPYPNSSSSPYHQNSSPNSPYQQPHSPYSNQPGQSGHGPPSSGPPSVGSMQIVTNSPNHQNGESPRDQNSPYQQQLNSPYQHSGHSSPYNQNSPYHQSSSPAHSSISSTPVQILKYAEPPIINMETATAVLEKHNISKFQSSGNDNVIVKSGSCDSIKSSLIQGTEIIKQKQQLSTSSAQEESVSPRHQQTQTQPQQLQISSHKSTQQNISQILQPPQYHCSAIIQNQAITRNPFDSNIVLSNLNTNQNRLVNEVPQSPSSPSPIPMEEPSSISVTTEKISILQYPRYQHTLNQSIQTEKTNSRAGFGSEIIAQSVSRQSPLNIPSIHSQHFQNQKQQHQSNTQQQSSVHQLHSQQSQQAQLLKRTFLSESNSNNSINLNLKSEEKHNSTTQQHSLYDVTTLNKHQQMFDGFLSSMTTAKNVGLNKPLDISTSKAYELINKATGIGLSTSLIAAASVINAKDNLNQLQQQQQHHSSVSSNTSNQQHQLKPDNLSNIYSQSALQLSSNNRLSLHLQQTQQQQAQQQSQTQSQHHQQQPAHRQQQHSQTSIFIGSKNSQSLSSSFSANSGSQNLSIQRNDPSEILPNQTANRNLDLSNYKSSSSSNYQNSSSILDHPLRHHSTTSLPQMMDDPNLLGLQTVGGSSISGVSSVSGPGGSQTFFDKGMPPAAHMFSKTLPQQLYQNPTTSALYGGRDQQNLPPPGNYVPQSNQSANNANSSANQQSEHNLTTSIQQTGDQKQKRTKKKKAAELASLNQSSVSGSGNNTQQSSSIIQQAHTQQSQISVQQQQQILSSNPNTTVSQNLTAAHQGFQLYAGLKSVAAAAAAISSSNHSSTNLSTNSSSSVATDTTAISLKTAAAAASMVPGSAFNFGHPSPSGLPIPGGIYADNTSYLEEFRNANPYYMTPAAPPAHHRVTPETTTSNPNQSGSSSDKSQPSSPSSLSSSNATATAAVAAAAAAASPYHQFLQAAAAHPAAQRPTYSFINSPQLDPNSPLYTQYLRPDEFRARMMQNLSQSLLPGAAAAYPQTGYRPTLGMPKPYDINNRQPWF